MKGTERTGRIKMKNLRKERKQQKSVRGNSEESDV